VRGGVVSARRTTREVGMGVSFVADSDAQSRRAPDGSARKIAVLAT
jgi:hypothetical protein